MESKFLNHFYNMHRIVSIAELTNTSEQNDESVIDCIKY